MINRRLRLATIAFGFVGLLVSIYLTWIKISHNQALCIQGIGDCWTVNTSRYAEVMGIPIALLGAFGYLAILVTLLLEPNVIFFNNYAVVIVFGLSLAGVLYSAYLTYVEIFVLRAICPYCVVSALSMLAIFVITVTRLARPQVTSLG